MLEFNAYCSRFTLQCKSSWWIGNISKGGIGSYDRSNINAHYSLCNIESNGAWEWRFINYGLGEFGYLIRGRTDSGIEEVLGFSVLSWPCTMLSAGRFGKFGRSD